MSLLMTVLIAGPDHMHAFEAVKALKSGEKAIVAAPVARTIEEANLVFAAAAKKHGRIAFGDFGPLSDVDRATIEKIHKFGNVRRVTVNCRTDMPHLGTTRPSEAQSAEGVKWSEWIGVMPLRPYYKLYVENEGWRAFLDFGTGPIGKDGARLLRPVFLALGLEKPECAERISVDGASPDRETYPRSVAVRFSFRGGVEVVWRHGSDLTTSVVWENDHGQKMTTNPTVAVPLVAQATAFESASFLHEEVAPVTETLLLGCCAMMKDRRVTVADCEKRYMRDGWEW